MGMALKNLHLVGCLIAFASCSPSGAKPAIEPDVAAIVSSTRDIQDTYAVYMWNEITPKGKTPFAEWSAEFHSGHLHRVENPNIRIIADCKAKSGTFISIETGERVEGPQVAKMACGIHANSEILSARKIGIKQTPFGKATAIEIIDPLERRMYDVSDHGILLGSTIGEKGEGGHVWVVSQATHLTRELPDDDIFSEESLSRSAVAERYRRPTLGKTEAN